MNECPRRAAELEVNKTSDGCVVYQRDQDRVHFLNHSSALIFEMCNGDITTEEIAARLRVEYGVDEIPHEDVTGCLADLRREGLIE